VLGSAARRRGDDSPDDYGLEERVQAGTRLRLGDAEQDEDDGELEREPDAIAARAWRSAIIGLFLLPLLLPLLHFYSCWLLFQLGWCEQPLSPAGRRHFMGAVIVNVLVFFVVLMLIWWLLFGPRPGTPPPEMVFPQFP
jgi:hypothetical protein